MKRLMKTFFLAIVGLAVAAAGGQADNVTRVYDNGGYEERARIDRYLDVEIWTNHADDEFYEGDNIVISFRTNRDAFVAIYSIDTRGRVNMLFPSDPQQDNFVYGGVTYRLPGGDDDFDLVITGPEGVENIQAIASRERFPIPDWYPTSGLICDEEDRHDFMDYLNNRYFVRYDGQRFAYDRLAIYVDEWEPYYFRPVYYPVYPTWTVCGNIYIDYPLGATVYIDGIYWGCTPIYIPRIFVGWHTFTIYDAYGYCWESDIHVTRYNTVVLGYDIVRPSPRVVSKYKEVRYVGYRDPVKNGYPDYQKKYKKILAVSAPVSSKASMKERIVGSKKKGDVPLTLAASKKYLRGEGKLVKTERGYETAGTSYGSSKKHKASRKSDFYYSKESAKSKKSKSSSGIKSKRSSSWTGYESSHSKSSLKGTKSSSKTSSSYYRKKSGSSHAAEPRSTVRSKTSPRKETKSIKTTKTKKHSGSKSYVPSKAAKKSGGATKSGGSYKSKGGGKPSPPAKSSSGRSSKPSRSHGKGKR